MKAPVALLAALLMVTAVQAQDVVIRGARVFDGTSGPVTVKDVLIRGERIVAVGKVRPKAGAREVDARGLTLIPGLSDLHVHTRGEAFADADALAEGYAPYLAHGVTSVNEYSVSGPMLAGIRAMETGRTPHLALAIRLGVPDGHGTESEFTNSITTQVTAPDEARAAMARLLPYRPDVIKVFADGWRYGDAARTDKASMDLPTLRAIVRAAHRRHVPVVTHTVTVAGAKIAARAGVDAVVHGIGDAAVDGETIRLMRRHRTAYVPTMAVYEPQQDRTFLPQEWRRLDEAARAREEKRRAGPREAEAAYVARRWATLRANLRRLKAAGIEIGLGTDTGIGGVYQGSATIREMRLMVAEGFTPAEVLTAATSVNADIMYEGRTHGRIAKGQRADLVLTGGMPDVRIEDVYDVRRVFVDGVEITPSP